MTELSFQLYSARNFPPTADVLAKLKALGYGQVEGYGGLYADAANLAVALKANGLTMPTGHFGLDMLKDVSTTLKTVETLGIKTVFCPAIGADERKQPEAGWVKLAETLAQLAETYKKAGVGFGWHNHHFEFWPTETGSLPMNILLDTAKDIQWEADVAWIVRGEQDPQKWFDAYGQRITAVHVKDIAPAGENTNEDGWADVGQGTMGWTSLIQTIRSKTRAQYFVAEHDNPSDLNRFATRTMDAWKSWK
ncbi:sugar phosphate isomerase/epimerase [Devosia sp.]|uniref:sugar phosphate isomerase/epimerase family protein n=1 Tax=Devosia sp. TaxID=1871048 RepID=UPI003264FF1D